MTVVSTGVRDPADTIHSGIPSMISIASNAALNIYATIFLATRLLAHRKLVAACLGNKAPVMGHLSIATILLESAAINVPIAIATAVGLGTGQIFGEIMVFIAPPSQVRAN